MDLKDTKNIREAKSYLATCTDKRIVIRSLRELAMVANISGIENYLGASRNNPDHILIALNDEKPETNENSFVHEIIHVVLDLEGFPDAVINEGFSQVHLSPNLAAQLPKLCSFIRSSITHPEVYRRMNECFDLDMDCYFDSLLQQKINRFDRRQLSTIQNKIFSDQQDILESIEYHHYNDPYRDKILSVFQHTSPKAFDIYSSIITNIAQMGLNDPKSCYDAANIIKREILNYGLTHNIGFINNMWDSIDIIDKSHS